MHVDGHDLDVGVSIGMALYQPGYQLADELLRDADAALYRAKAVRKGRLVLVDAAQHESAVKAQELESELRRAAQRQEFRVYYQPLGPLDGGPPCGFEALLRWKHPERGLLPAAGFVGLLEETGLLVEVGGWVLDQACRQAAAARQPGWTPATTVTVNLSAAQLQLPDLAARVARTLAESGLAPGRLVLDIPESALTGNGQALEALRGLHGLGVALHLDDFGSELTSLRLLHQAPLDAFKISMAGLEMGLARIAVQLAGALGRPVVAKKIETPEQVEALRGLGCALGQGYWLGGPKDLTPPAPLP
jgi:EAL domain-containing protein (putative c-di-GMP-specific phosphodiesterase class I)